MKDLNIGKDIVIETVRKQSRAVTFNLCEDVNRNLV